MSGPDLKPIQPPTGRRHRITFGTSRSLAYVSVLELGTVWERTLRRARTPLKYSQGFNPRPRMHFAAPLPVGCGTEADLLDVLLDEAWPSGALLRALRSVAPQDLTVIDTRAVPDDDPALSEQLTQTEYRVWLRDVKEEAVATAIEKLLAQESVLLPKRGRRHRGKSYDLRPLIVDLQSVPDTPTPWSGLWMRLQARPGATGRPDEVLKALGLVDHPQRCFRTRLILET